MIAFAPTGAMPTVTVADKIVRALYTHGPCGLGTLAALVGEDDAGAVARSLAPMVGSRVTSRTVALPGTGIAPVELFYLRGAGIG